MRCSNCDKEFDEHLDDCPHCGAVVDKTNETTVISAGERDGFSGVTIVDGHDDNKNDDKETFYRQNSAGNQKIYVKNVKFSGGSIMTKLLILFALAFIIFILLPAFLIGFAVLAFIWFVFSLFK